MAMSEWTSGSECAFEGFGLWSSGSCGEWTAKRDAHGENGRAVRVPELGFGSWRMDSMPDNINSRSQSLSRIRFLNSEEQYFREIGVRLINNFVLVHLSKCWQAI